MKKYLLIVSCIILLAPALFAAGDITIHVNYPDDIIFANTANWVEIWFQHEPNALVGLSIGFEFTSSAGSFVWFHDGNEPTGAQFKYIHVESVFTGVFNLAHWESVNSFLPGRILIGGAAIPPAGLPVLVNSTRVVSLHMDGTNITDTSGVFCVDNVFIPPAGTWTFDQGAGGLAPTFNGNPNSSELNPDAPPICFPVRNLVKGDSDGSGFVSISDVVHLINYIFGGGSAPSPMRAGDADCNRIISISDAVYIRNYIFGGPAPC